MEKRNVAVQIKNVCRQAWPALKIITHLLAFHSGPLQPLPPGYQLPTSLLPFGWIQGSDRHRVGGEVQR